MSRPISDRLAVSLEEQHSDEVLLCFVTISHDELAEPIRVVSENHQGISYANGKPINYLLDGHTYLAMPFGFNLPSDDERAPRVSLTIPNVDRLIGATVAELVTSPRIDIAVYALADWNSAVDVNNARSPIGVPVRELAVDYLFIKSVTADAMTVVGDLTTYDLADEPWPNVRVTKDRFPGVFL